MAETVTMSSEYNVPVLMLAHPSKEPGDLATARMRKGEIPEPSQAVSGSMHVVNTATLVSMLTRLKKNTSLFTQVKNRIGGQLDDVYQVSIDDKFEFTYSDGEKDADAVVLSGVWQKHKKIDSKFGKFVEWLWHDAGAQDEDSAIRFSACKKRAGCPVQEQTARKYVIADDAFA